MPDIARKLICEIVNLFACCRRIFSYSMLAGLSQSDSTAMGLAESWPDSSCFAKLLSVFIHHLQEAFRARASIIG